MPNIPPQFQQAIQMPQDSHQQSMPQYAQPMQHIPQPQYPEHLVQPQHQPPQHYVQPQYVAPQPPAVEEQQQYADQMQSDQAQHPGVQARVARTRPAVYKPNRYAPTTAPVVGNIDTVFTEIQRLIQKNTTLIGAYAFDEGHYNALMGVQHQAMVSNQYIWIEELHLNPQIGNNDIRWLLHLISGTVQKQTSIRSLLEYMTTNISILTRDNYANKELQLQTAAATCKGYILYLIKTLLRSKTPISNIKDIIEAFPSTYTSPHVSDDDKYMYKFLHIDEKSIATCRNTYNSFKDKIYVALDYIQNNLENIALEYERPEKLITDINALLITKINAFKKL